MLRETRGFHPGLDENSQEAREAEQFARIRELGNQRTQENAIELLQLLQENTDSENFNLLYDYVKQRFESDNWPEISASTDLLPAEIENENQLLPLLLANKISFTGSNLENEHTFLKQIKQSDNKIIAYDFSRCGNLRPQNGVDPRPIVEKNILLLIRAQKINPIQEIQFPVGDPLTSSALKEISKSKNLSEIKEVGLTHVEVNNEVLEMLSDPNIAQSVEKIDLTEARVQLTDDERVEIHAYDTGDEQEPAFEDAVSLSAFSSFCNTDFPSLTTINLGGLQLGNDFADVFFNSKIAAKIRKINISNAFLDFENVYREFPINSVEELLLQGSQIDQWQFHLLFQDGGQNLKSIDISHSFFTSIEHEYGNGVLPESSVQNLPMLKHFKADLIYNPTRFYEFLSISDFYTAAEELSLAAYGNDFESSEIYYVESMSEDEAGSILSKTRDRLEKLNLEGHANVRASFVVEQLGKAGSLTNLRELGLLQTSFNNERFIQAVIDHQGELQNLEKLSITFDTYNVRKEEVVLKLNQLLPNCRVEQQLINSF